MSPKKMMFSLNVLVIVINIIGYRNKYYHTSVIDLKRRPLRCQTERFQIHILAEVIFFAIKFFAVL